MLDDDKDMADMYLTRRGQADDQKGQQEAREELEPNSPTRSLASVESFDDADFMGQTDAESELPAHPSRRENPLDRNYIQGVAPTQQAPPPPQVINMLSALHYRLADGVSAT